MEAILLGILLRYMHASNFSVIPGNPGLSTQYNAVVPGSSIPEWFIHQSAGCLVPVELPPHRYNTKLMGLAVCAVFNAHITMGELDELGFSVNESGSFYIDDGASMHFSKAAYIWFGYRPLADLFWGSGGSFRNQSNTLKVSFSISNSEGKGLRKWCSCSI